MPELSLYDWNCLAADGCEQVVGKNLDADTLRAVKEEAKARGIEDFTVQLGSKRVRVGDKTEEAPGLYILEKDKVVVTQALIDLLTPEVAGRLVGALMGVKRTEELKGEQFWIRVGFVAETAGLTSAAVLATMKESPDAGKGDKPVLNRRQLLAASAAAALFLVPNTARAMGQHANDICQLEEMEAPPGCRAALAKINHWYKERNLQQDGWVQGV